MLLLKRGKELLLLLVLTNTFDLVRMILLLEMRNA